MDTVVTDARDLYVADFQRIARTLPGFSDLRRKAMGRFADRGFPTGREESWRFTDVTPLTEIAFKPAAGTANPNQFAGLAKGALKACQIAFVDGRFVPSFSSLDLPRGVEVTGLGEILKAAPDEIVSAIDPSLLVPDGPFAALNTAFFRDGATIRIADGVVLDRPIHVLFLSSLHGDPYVMHPRNVISLGKGAKATVVNSFLGPSRGATFTHHSISLGARLARNDFHVLLAGEGAECSLFGLYEVAGAQHVDHHTTIDHAKPHCTSRELYKGVLDGRSRAVFDGRIVVRPDAQKTSAMQTNKNLLLSKEALVHTKPQLEIFANDVKCKHGATIGQLDADVLFYLRSRGIGLAEARRLLIHAFASEIIDTVKADAVRSQIGGCLALIAGGA